MTKEELKEVDNMATSMLITIFQDIHQKHLTEKQVFWYLTKMIKVLSAELDKWIKPYLENGENKE